MGHERQKSSIMLNRHVRMEPGLPSLPSLPPRDPLQHTKKEKKKSLYCFKAYIIDIAIILLKRGIWQGLFYFCFARCIICFPYSFCSGGGWGGGHTSNATQSSNKNVRRRFKRSGRALGALEPR